MTREAIDKCPKCGSKRLTYCLGKDGVCVECRNCGLKGPKASTSWYADRLWNQMKKGEEK